MILYPLTIFIGLTMFGLSIIHLNQVITNYFDIIAFMLVFGGTFAIAISIMPWRFKTGVKRSAKILFSKEHVKYKEILSNCFAAMQDGSTLTLLKDNSISTRILKDGYDLMGLGFTKEQVETILREKIYQSTKGLVKVSDAIKSVAKYPPAFGLMGTVLGLINVMRGLTAGADAKQTGLEMAIALLATMYGLVMANLIVNPAAEIILKKSEEEEEYAELALQTIILIMKKSDGTFSPLEAQEILNSFVPEDESVNQLFVDGNN